MRNTILFLVTLVTLCVGMRMLDSHKAELADYLDAWLKYNSGQIDQAKKIIDQYYAEGTNYEGWPVLRAAILASKEKKYADALDCLREVRDTIRQKYQESLLHDNGVPEDERKVVEFNYEKMLITSGLASFKLGKWQDALKDLLAYARDNPDPSVYEAIGISYYERQNKMAALDYFNKAYGVFQEKDCKITVAYNIAAVNASMGNLQNAVRWLKLPLKNDPSSYLEEIANDRDFDPVRHNEVFVDFLKQYRQTTSMKKGGTQEQ